MESFCCVLRFPHSSRDLNFQDVADVGFSQTTISVAKFTPPAEGAEKSELCVETLARQSAPVGTQSLASSLAAHMSKDMKEPLEIRSKRGIRLMAVLHKAVKELSGIPCFVKEGGSLGGEIV